MATLIPDLLWRNGRFHAGMALECDPASGRIVRVGPAERVLSTGGSGGGPEAGSAGSRAEGHALGSIEHLRGRALLPGFVNAHSHAFQRLMRGRTQWRPASAPDADFWSWREAMYSTALALSPDDIFHVSRFCFLEMLRAGITTVGEFHYLHRDRHGNAYADPNELAHRVIAAADDVGLRIALLNVCYATGDIGRPLRPEQRRFATPVLDDYLAATRALLDAYAPEKAGDGAYAGSGAGDVEEMPNRLVTIGVAPHSIRAVPRRWLCQLHAWAAEREIALHMHVSEQTREVDACLDAYGARPVQVLAEEDALDERLTAVHATHITGDEVELLADAGATVCACPTTERDLGDGFLPGAALLEAGVRIAFGSDSHTIIDPLEEMRLIEYHERLRQHRRVVLATPRLASVTHGTADRLEAAPLLLELTAQAGSQALRIDGGRLEPGMLADFLTVDLEHPVLAGWTHDSLAAMLALSAPADVVADVWVGGLRRVGERRHPLAAEITTAFREVAGRVG